MSTIVFISTKRGSNKPSSTNADIVFLWWGVKKRKKSATGTLWTVQEMCGSQIWTRPWNEAVTFIRYPRIKNARTRLRVRSNYLPWRCSQGKSYWLVSNEAFFYWKEKSWCHWVRYVSHCQLGGNRTQEYTWDPLRVSFLLVKVMFSAGGEKRLEVSEKTYLGQLAFSALESFSLSASRD